MAGFPVVPIAPGVPALVRDPVGALTDFATLLIGDIVSGFDLSAPQWGVYKDGAPVVAFDSFLGVDYRQDWAIADYPVEQGGFDSYDKVDTPFNVRVRFASGGSVVNKTALLQSIDAIAGTLDLFDVVTPEAVYQSVNVQQYDYRRNGQGGLGLLSVDMMLVEIRVTGVSDFKNTKSASGADTTDGGTVQTTPAPSALSPATVN